MKVVLAEKPSVARDLAGFLGAQTRRDGYIEGNGVQITWAFGHLVTLQEPEDYDPAFKRWSLDDLPIIPDEFALKLTGDDGAKKQFETVKKLFCEAEEIVCATDAGREGELIFRYILELSGCEQKPIRRLWLSSLTKDAIRKAFAELKPGADYDALYAAARCRSEADWIVGMNATRNFTVRFGGRGILWSVGRVQTPVLALIAARDEEIRHFDPKPWFELRTRYRDVVFKSRADRFQVADAANTAADAIRGTEFVVTAVKVREERVQPPQLFDLTSLQRDMNQRYGLSAQDTLQCAQALYERKCITYPRTDSRYLTRDMASEVARVLNLASARYGERAARIDVAALTSGRLDKRVFDDNKVEDHHAILPTGNEPGGLDERHQRVYDAIFLRLIAAFSPACHKEITAVDGFAGEGSVEGGGSRQDFRASGVRIVDPGWTTVHPPRHTKKAASGKSPKKGGSEDEPEQVLPAFEVAERGPHEPEVHAGETKPPRAFTENSLLGAMETAGKLVDDDQLAEALKAKGLGTPATRANIIETLLRRRFIARDKKALRITDLGRVLISLIQNPILKSPEMTGEWESQLKDVEAGRMEPAAFMASIRDLTEDVVSSSAPSNLRRDVFGSCPQCGESVIEGSRGYGCSAWESGCKFVLWKDCSGHHIAAEQARELLQRGISLKPVRLDDQLKHLQLTSKGILESVPVPLREHQKGPLPKAPNRNKKAPGSAGTKTSAKASAGGGAKAKQAAVCPLCGGGMLEREKSFSCSGGGGGCRFVIWKEIAGKKISKAMAKKLLTKGETQVLKGFTSKAGKKFDAKLKVQDGKVAFDF